MQEAKETSDVPNFIQENFEDELSQECRELLPSLPKERGLINHPHVYNYQGYWYFAKQLQGVIQYQKHFEAKDDDIFLATTPKSGTTWLKAIVFTLVNRGKYDVSNPQHPLFSKNPHDLIPFIELRIYMQCPNPDFSGITSPRLFATHLPFATLSQSVQSSPCKVVYLCRNPKDTFVSLWHYSNEFRRMKKMDPISIEDEFDMFCRGVTLWGPYWDHVLGYWQKSLEMPHRIFFLKYEEMKQQPLDHLKKLAELFDCPFSAEEESSGLPEEILKLCSFDNLSNLEVNKTGKLLTGVEKKSYFRRGEVGDWKNFLTTEMIERLDCLAEQKFHPFGLQL